jgi:hypothetical protein
MPVPGLRLKGPDTSLSETTHAQRRDYAFTLGTCSKWDLSSFTSHEQSGRVLDLSLLHVSLQNIVCNVAGTSVSSIHFMDVAMFGASELQQQRVDSI